MNCHDYSILCTERCFLMGFKCKSCLLRVLSLFLVLRIFNPYKKF